MVRFLSSRRFLAVYSGCLTLVFAVTVLAGFARSSPKNASFDQITVRRVNVIEPNGTVRMVISDRDEFPGLYLHDKEIRDRTGRIQPGCSSSTMRVPKMAD